MSPHCSAAVSGTILIDFPSFKGRGELRPWSDLAVGVAECPKIATQVLMLDFCYIFSMISSLSPSYCSAVVSGPIVIGFPSFEGHDGCRHGQIWLLAVGVQKLPPWFSCLVFPKTFCMLWCIFPPHCSAVVAWPMICGVPLY